MKRRKSRLIYPIAFVSILIFSLLFIYPGKSSLFPDKLGDMEMKLHREGDVAINDIKNSHSAKDGVNPEEAHVARYRNSQGNRADGVCYRGKDGGEGNRTCGEHE